MTKNQEPKKYTLAQVRRMKQENGVLQAVQWVSRMSGMAMNSYEKTVLFMDLRQECPVLTEEETKGMNRRTVRVWQSDSGTARKLRDLVQSENLASWSLLEEEQLPDNMILRDMSSESYITLRFSDTGNGSSETAYTVNVHAAGRQGGWPVLEKLKAWMTACRIPENLIREELPEPEEIPAYAQIPRVRKEGTWICPECRADGNTGKFCTECGCRKPEE